MMVCLRSDFCSNFFAYTYSLFFPNVQEDVDFCLLLSAIWYELEMFFFFKSQSSKLCSEGIRLIFDEM